MLTNEERALMDRREELTQSESLLVDYVFGTLRECSKELHVPTANDDRAACFEAALIRFILESRKK
jgi:hypothetical protein